MREPSPPPFSLPVGGSDSCGLIRGALRRCIPFDSLEVASSSLVLKMDVFIRRGEVWFEVRNELEFDEVGGKREMRRSVAKDGAQNGSVSRTWRPSAISRPRRAATQRLRGVSSRWDVRWRFECPSAGTSSTRGLHTIPRHIPLRAGASPLRPSPLFAPAISTQNRSMCRNHIRNRSPTPVQGEGSARGLMGRGRLSRLGLCLQPSHRERC